jgi:PAS domain S-box-containing protein
LAKAKKMSPKKKPKEDLRRRAERLLSKKTKTIPKIPAGDMKKLIQELQVHQVELEIQNEELRKAQAEIEESRSRYVDLYDFAPVSYFTLTPTGEIAGVNLTGAGLLGIERSKLLGRFFSVFAAPEFRSVFRQHCSEVLKKRERERCELKLMKKDGTSFYVQLESIGVDGNKKNPTWIRSAVIDITKQKHAEEDLKHRTKELETLAENAPDVIFRVERNLRFIFVNKKISDLTGISKDQFYGKTLLDLGLPRDICDYLGKKTQEVFDHQIINEFEFNFSGLEGLRWFHTRVVPEFDNHGNFETVLGIAHDITDLKRAEHAYMEEYALRKSIEESLIVGIAAVDRDGRQSYVNPSFCKMVGWSKEELLGAKPPFVYWAPEETKSIQESFKAILNSEESSGTLELSFQRKNGKRFDALVLNSPLKDSQENVIGLIGSIGDITDQRRKEKEIRRLNIELEERVRQRTIELMKVNRDLEDGLTEIRLSEHLNEALNLINLQINSRPEFDELMQTIVTEAAKAMGCETAAVILKKGGSWIMSYVYGFPQEMVGGEMTDEEEPHAVLSIRTKKPVIIEDAYTDKRVNREHMKRHGVRSALVVPIIAEDTPIGVIFFNYHAHLNTFRPNQVDFCIKLSSSVSFAIQNTHLLKDLEHHAKELENANKELESFSYSASHDLKAPLIVAIGFGRILSDRYGEKLDDKGRHYLQRIQESCEHMNLLTEDLLNLSKVTAEKMNVNPIDLSELVKSIATQLKVAQPEREASFLIEEGLNVKGDFRLLRIALENLLGNAWKFTGKCKRTEIEFGLLKPIKEDPTYFVRDNGCGFDMSLVDNLFTPFQRFHSDQEFAGTGVGLTIAHRIITRHGGRIWAESKVDKGTTFFFTLPSR